MPWSSVEPYRLKLLGPWDLRGPEAERVSSVLAQPKRLCLLAYLAMAEGPVSRSTVVALFWPESDEERARNALSQALFHLRRSLSKDVVESVDGNTRLAVSPERLYCDARAFLERCADPAQVPDPDSVAVARSIVGGADFFEGWNADDCQAVQEWLDGVRRRVREVAVAVVKASTERERERSAMADQSGDGRITGEQATDASTTEPARFPRALDRARRYAVAAVVILVVTAATAAAVAWKGDDPDRPPPGGVTPAAGPTGSATAALADSRPVVAVLMPSVTAADSSIPRLADAVQAEILAALDGMVGIRSIPFSSADAGGLDRFLSEQFQAPGSATPPGVSPDWVIVVSLRIAGSRIRALTQFRDGSTSHLDWYPEGEDYEAPTPGDALIEVPQEIARDVARRFEGWIARERPTPRQPSG